MTHAIDAPRPAPAPDLSQVFAKHVANVRFGGLPPEAVEAAKKSTLDTIGVILGASGTTPMLAGLVEIVREAGGKEESAILGFGGRAPSFMAAFLNGAMTHCMDFDDHLPEGHHPSSAVIPGVLAVAERVGGVSGEEFITAVALAQDLFARLRRHVTWKEDWHLTTVIAVFATAAACGRILKLSESQLVDALGIAYLQSSGTMELAYGTGSDLRGIYSAFTSKAGVLAALMAQKGITGTRSSFEGKAGLFNVYFEGKYDRAGILDKLGSRFLGAEIIYKPWPSCGLTHAYIDAALGLLREHAITPDDIQHVKVMVGESAKNLCEPLPLRRAPATTVDAKFSIPFSVAVALVHGNVKIEHFTKAALRDPAALAMAARITPVLDASLNWGHALPAAVVEITTRNGSAFERRVTAPLGSPQKPMTWGDLEEKFADCARFSKTPLVEARVRDFCSLARRLETVKDIRELLTCVA
jgi:2-methylcitrate dehydratase PrpD